MITQLPGVPSLSAAGVQDRQPDSLSLMLDRYFDAHNTYNPGVEVLSPLAFAADTVLAPWDTDHLAPRVRPLFLGEVQQLFPVHRPDANPQAMAFVSEVQARFDGEPTMISWIVEPGKLDIVLEGPEFTSEKPLEQQGMPDGEDRVAITALLRDALDLISVEHCVADTPDTSDILTASDYIGKTMYPRRELLRVVQ